MLQGGHLVPNGGAHDADIRRRGLQEGNRIKVYIKVSVSKKALLIYSERVPINFKLGSSQPKYFFRLLMGLVILSQFLF